MSAEKHNVQTPLSPALDVRKLESTVADKNQNHYKNTHQNALGDELNNLMSQLEVMPMSIPSVKNSRRKEKDAAIKIYDK